MAWNYRLSPKQNLHFVFYKKKVQKTMDTHQRIFMPIIKLSLTQNKKSVNPKVKQYEQIQRGARLLWRNYFRYADEEDQTTTILEPLTTVVMRLNRDLQEDNEDIRCIKAYATLFGFPLHAITPIKN